LVFLEIMTLAEPRLQTFYVAIRMQTSTVAA
jgi:hypothetical protein